MTEQQLADLFSAVGPVKASRLATDRETGRFRGYGFVEFFDVPTAEAAARNLSGTDLGGRAIRINFAEEHQMQGAGGPGGGGGGGGPAGGPGGGFRSGGGRPVGAVAAQQSAAAVAQLLGAPPSTDREVQEGVDRVFAGMSRRDLWEVLRELRDVAFGGSLGPNAPPPDRHRAAAFFAERPGLTKAVFQAQVLLGLVQAPGALDGGGPPPMPMPPPPRPMPVAPGGGPPPPPYPGAAPPPPYGAPPPPPPYGMGPGPGAAPPPPRPMQPAPMQHQQQQAPMQQQQPQQPELATPEQVALLQQVQAMSEAQVAALPAEYRDQVLFIKGKLARGEVRLP